MNISTISFFILLSLSQLLCAQTRSSKPGKRSSEKAIKEKIYTSPGSITREEIEHYLRFNTEGEYSEFAINHLYRFYYDEAIEDGSKTAYKDFLERVPVTSIKFLPVVKLYRDLRWEEVDASGKLEEYLLFRQEFPGSVYEETINMHIEYDMLNKSDIEELCRYIINNPKTIYRSKVKEIVYKQLVSIEEGSVTRDECENFDLYVSTFPGEEHSIEFFYRRKKIEHNYALWDQYSNSKDYLKYMEMVNSSREKYFYVEESKDIMNEVECYVGVKNRNSKDSWEKYIRDFPSGLYIAEAKNKFTQLELAFDNKLFNTAKKSGWNSDFQEYVKEMPQGRHIREVKNKLLWLEDKKAVCQIDYAKTVYGRESQWSNVSSPVFKYKIKLEEVGGSIGYKVSGKPSYVDNEGSRWYSDGGDTVIEVKPGQTFIHDSWVSGDQFKGGYISVNFSGEDAAGNPVSFKVKIDCK